MQTRKHDKWLVRPLAFISAVFIMKQIGALVRCFHQFHTSEFRKRCYAFDYYPYDADDPDMSSSTNNELYLLEALPNNREIY